MILWFRGEENLKVFGQGEVAQREFCAYVIQTKTTAQIFQVTCQEKLP